VAEKQYSANEQIRTHHGDGYACTLLCRGSQDGMQTRRD
jgi:hypothetical protein